MELVTVTSKMIYAVGYEADTQTLHVQFQPRTKKDDSVVPGALWEYSAVPQDVFDRFLAAESMGKFFGTFIRANYVGKKVETA